MDLRTERTKNSIKSAFLELRKQKPLEKITVKELAELAYINKATFYTHYHDIFDLTDQLENDFFDSTFENVAYLDCLVSNPGLATKELTKALAAQTELSNILFSGSRQGYYSSKLTSALRKLIDEKYPEKVHDLKWNIVITVLIQGCYHAAQLYQTENDLEEVTQILAAISDTLTNQFL